MSALKVLTSAPVSVLTIYSTSESLYCAKLRILLNHKQAQWQEVEPEGGCGSDYYRQLIPLGTMPAMIDGELVIADSEAIAEYLNEILVEPEMLPPTAAGRAKCRERSRFHDTRLEPELRALFPHVGPGQIGSEISIKQSQKISERLEELARLIQSDPNRDQQLLSLGDCGFPITFAWMDAFQPVMGLDIRWSETVSEYRAQIESHTAVANVLIEYTPNIKAWMASKNA